MCESIRFIVISPRRFFYGRKRNICCCRFVATVIGMSQDVQRGNVKY